MKPRGLVFPVVGLLVVAYFVSRSRRAPEAPPPAKPSAPAPEKLWTADDMAKDPEGYLLWADRRLREQIAHREGYLATLTDKRRAIEAKQKKLVGNLEEIDNFRKRLEDAIRRAEDEDRWPVQIAGKSFERAQAKAKLEEARQVVEERRPLAADYSAAIGRMADRAQAFTKEVAEAKRLRERILLDLERVRLKQALPDLDDLRRTEEEIAHYAKLLASLDEAPAPKEAPAVDLQSLLD